MRYAAFIGDKSDLDAEKPFIVADLETRTVVEKFHAQKRGRKRIPPILRSFLSIAFRASRKPVEFRDPDDDRVYPVRFYVEVEV